MSTSWQWSIRYIWYPSDLVKCRTYHVDMHHIKKSLRFALTIVVDVKKRIILSNYQFERRLTHIFLRDVRFNRRHEDIRQSDRTRRKEVRQDTETRQRNDVKVSCVKCRLTSLKSRVQKKGRCDYTDPSQKFDDDPVDYLLSIHRELFVMRKFCVFLSFIFHYQNNIYLNLQHITSLWLLTRVLRSSSFVDLCRRRWNREKTGTLICLFHFFEITTKSDIHPNETKKWQLFFALLNIVDTYFSSKLLDQTYQRYHFQSDQDSEVQVWFRHNTRVERKSDKINDFQFCTCDDSLSKTANLFFLRDVIVDPTG